MRSLVSTRHTSWLLLALLLLVPASARTAYAGQGEAAEESMASFATVAKNLRTSGKKAFAEERWSDAVAEYGRLVSHLLDGGYAGESVSVASSRLRIAVAFKNSGDYPAARTMLLHLAESAPQYEVTKRQILLNEVRATFGLPPLPVSAPVVAPRVEGPVRVGGDVTRPELVSRTVPVYTWEARRARIQGVVIVEVTIDTAGNVYDVDVLKPLPMGLDQAAVTAVRQWKFRPATRRGRPVAVRYNLTVNFRLQ